MPPARGRAFVGEVFDLAPSGEVPERGIAANYYPLVSDTANHWVRLQAFPHPRAAGREGGGGVIPVADTWVLPFPEGLTFTDNHVYDPVSHSALAGDFLKIAQNTPGANKFAVVKNIFDGIGEAAGLVDKLGKLGGTPILSSVEIIYANTLQRRFIFSFGFSPRNEEESLMIAQIVKSFRYYAAPTPLVGDVTWVWDAPWYFEMEFYSNGFLNKYIPRISACGLEKIDVNYQHFTGGNWSAYAEDGAPVGTYLTLSFVEFEVSHAEKVGVGF